MIIRSIISSDFNALSSEDTVQTAMLTMEDLNVVNFPVADRKKLVGYVYMSDLLDLNPEDTLSTLTLRPGKQIHPEESLFQGIHLFAETRFDVLAVCVDEEVIGMVWLKDLVGCLGKSTTVFNHGAVVLLRCSIQDYSISQLGRIVESGDGKILGLWTWFNEESKLLEVMVKLNIQHIDDMSLLLAAHGYEVVQRINNIGSDFTDERYQSLIKYLNI